jgi:hypothetical protein
VVPHVALSPAISLICSIRSQVVADPRYDPAVTWQEPVWIHLFQAMQKFGMIVYLELLLLARASNKSYVQTCHIF